MKTLYISDLDGTLLNSQGALTEYTANTIDRLIKDGLVFSYATARSYVTAKKVTQKLSCNIPIIIYNGTHIADSATGNFIHSEFFDKSSACDMLNDLMSHDVYPIVYSVIDNKEQFSYIKEKMSRKALEFLSTREGDIRSREVDSADRLFDGDIFYFTCIDESKKLKPLYDKYKDMYRTLFTKDVYTDNLWLELMPKRATKANAVQTLKKLLNCDKVVVFGDGENDIDMFKSADVGIAVSNAHEKLKEIATCVIDSNDQDAVARWLLNNF